MKIPPRSTRSCRTYLATLFAAACIPLTTLSARAADALAPAAILQDMKSFRTLASVLMIAAHPDDENTQLITYLARGRHYRTAYLSLTRGDGGQNVLGGEFGSELGLIRTEELLAARHLDSGRQFFTRALDFGFSTNPDETLKIWDRQEVLSDVVRVIRTFQPDVIVTRFSPTGTNTHGHHTASAILGLEAFKLAGDPKAFPDQVATLGTWQPTRIFLNGMLPGPVRNANAGGGAANADGSVRIDAGGIDPVLKIPYTDIASQSRAMHKSQGFDNLGGGRGGRSGGGGGGGGGGARSEFFQLLDGAPATDDIVDGIDTTWARIPGGGSEVGILADAAIAAFNPQDPSASVHALLEIKKRAAALTATVPHSRLIDEKLEQLDYIIAECLGLSVETTIPNAQVVPGEAFKLHHTATITSNIPVQWKYVLYSTGGSMREPSITLVPNQTASRDLTASLGPDTPVSQPYWLREEGKTGMFRVDDPTLIGRPENPPTFPITQTFEVDGQIIFLPDEPVQIIPNASPAQSHRRLDVIAPVSMAFPSQVRLFAPRTAKSGDVEITAHHAASKGSLKLNVPTGWTVTPPAQPFSLAAIGDHAQFTFTVTPPAQPASGTLSAAATIGDQTFTTSRKEISYPHIPYLLLQPPATIKAVALDLKIAGKTIGYLPGAGDSVDECIRQMGYTVTELKTADLTPQNLKQFDAIVTGVRAFNTRTDLSPDSPALKALFDYVQAGGTIVEQYSRPDGPGGTNGRPTTLAPYPIHLSALRVTDETAPVKFLLPDSPVLNTPNKITDADFANWVQERNIYLPDQVDPNFQPILAMADPGETPPNNSLLVANYGQGHFIYTSLVFFRQLPAANPGAYRLFANLLSLGKQ